MDPIVEVRELANNYKFVVPNSTLSEIVRDLNEEINTKGFMLMETYKGIINKHISDPYKLPSNMIDDIIGFRARQDREIFDARVMWVRDKNGEMKAIGELTYRILEPLRYYGEL